MAHELLSISLRGAHSVAATRTPIMFIGTGEHQQDLERFSPKPFISKMLGMGDLQGLMEHVQDVSSLNDPKKQQDMLNKMEKGVFTIRDMREQMNTVLSMCVVLTPWTALADSRTDGLVLRAGVLCRRSPT